MATDYVERLRYEADITDLKAKWGQMEAGSKATADEVSSHGGIMSRGWDGFKSTISTIGTSLLKVGGLAATGLAALGAYGINAAGDFQQTRIAFEGLLGDAQTADTFLRQMRDFAAKTPFELPGVLDAARQLMATGTSAENVVPVLTKIGNVASALGVGEESIQGVVRALGQMQGKGKASAEELNQIGEAIPGFSAIKAVAEGMGVTVSEAFDQMSKGAVPADKAIGFILAGMEKFPGAAGAMDRQSHTLNGVISTLKDTFRNALIDGIEPFLPGLAKFGETLAPLMGRIVTFAVGGLKQAIAVIADVARGVRSMGAAWGTAYDDVDHASGMMGVFQRIGETARRVFDFIIGQIRVFLYIVKGGDRDVSGDSIIARVASMTREVGDLIARIWPTIANVITTAVSIIVAALPVLADILLTLGEALVASIGWLLDHHELLIGIGVVIGVGLVAAFIQWAIAAGAAAVATIAAIAPVIAIAAAIALLVAGVIWAYENWGWFRAAVDGVAHFLADVLWPAIVTIVEWLGDHLGPVILAVAGFLKDTLWPILVEVGKFLGEAYVTYVRTVIGILTELIGWLVNLGTTAYNITRDVINFFVDVYNFFVELPGKLRNVAGDMFGFVRDAFRDAINWVLDKWNSLDFGIHINPPFGLPGPSFNIDDIFPDVPRLAGGGVITRPTVALLGETARARPEIASPVDLMRSVMRDELDRAGAATGGPLISIGTFAGRDIATVDELERMADRSLFAARVGAANY